MMVGESNEPWLGKVPSKWAIRRIKDIAELKCGDGITSESITPVGDFPVFGGNGLRGYTTSFTHEGHYVLIGRQGALCGNINYAKGKFWASEHAVVASMTGKIDTYWLGELLRDMNFNQYSNAAAQPGLAVDRIKFLRMPVPPLEEQQRIAAYLDASCAAIDAAVAAKRRQLETLDALRTTLIYEAVTRGINPSEPTVIHDIPSYGPTPEHWKRSKLRYEISIQNGDFASDKLQDDGTHPIFGGNGVMGHTDLSNVDGQTVVIGRVGAYCGNAHYVQGKAWVSDNALIVKSLHYARFLCHLFNALNFNAQANNTAQPVITGTKIKNTYVVLPAPAEQEAICIFLDVKLSDVKRIVAGIEQQIITLIAYRKSLIHECVTGQRRITEANVRRAEMGAETNLT